MTSIVRVDGASKASNAVTAEHKSGIELLA